MVKSGVGKIMKCLLFTATFLIFAGGIAVLGVGIWAVLNKVSSVEELLGNEAYTYASFALIAAGAAIAFVSFLGCCGAYKEDKMKLFLYFLVLLIIFFILLAGGILGFVFKDKVDAHLLDQMEKTVKHYGDKKYITNAWDAIHVYFECCGLSRNSKESYEIWEDNVYLKNESLVVPMSCCKDIENPGPCQQDPKANIHYEDCYVVVKQYIRKNSKIVGGIGIGIAGALLIGMVLTCCLYQRLPKG